MVVCFFEEQYLIRAFISFPTVGSRVLAILFTYSSTILVSTNRLLYMILTINRNGKWLSIYQWAVSMQRIIQKERIETMYTWVGCVGLEGAYESWTLVSGWKYCCSKEVEFISFLELVLYNVEPENSLTLLATSLDEIRLSWLQVMIADCPADCQKAGNFQEPFHHKELELYQTPIATRKRVYELLAYTMLVKSYQRPWKRRQRKRRWFL